VEDIMPPSGHGRDQEWIISSEFARVRLAVGHRGYDSRLRIEDLANDACVALDASVLAALATACAEEARLGSEKQPASSLGPLH
jgi:hypothetical protein